MTAVQINDPQIGLTSITRTSRGLRAETFYRVDSADAAAVIDDADLPALGDAFSATYTTLLVTERQIVRVVGGDSSGADGVSFVRVSYQEPSEGFGGPDDSSQVGDVHHQLNDAVVQVPIKEDIDGNPIPDTTVELTTEEIVVTAYVDSYSWISHWRSIRNRINSNNVTIPARANGVAGFVAPAGTLLARSARTRDVRAGVMAVEYRFGYGNAGDFDFVFAELDQDGRATGVTNTADVYAEASFNTSSLWGP